MKRWNGGRPRSYLQEDGQSSYTISSCSGTASTVYTSTGSHMSSISLVAAMHLELEGVTTEEEQIKHIKSWVQKFFGSPSANCSINGGDMSVLERWLTELGVGWVVHLADGAPAPAEVDSGWIDDARSWIRALAQIVETIRFTTTLFPDRGSMPSICEEGHDQYQFQLRRVTSKLFRGLRSKLFRSNCEEEPVAIGESGEQEEAVPDQVQFAQFFQETMLKMLAFVDSVAAVPEGSNRAHEPKKLVTLLGVHDALSTALPQIRLSSYSPPSEQVFKIQREIVSLLAAKQDKTGEAIRSAMEQIWTSIMEFMEDGNDSQQGSSDIHRATRSAIRYIEFLRANYLSVAPIVTGAARYGHGKYVPQNGDIPSLDSMVLEMASCLEEKLGQMSASFPDHSLGFLFLINNLYYLIEQLRPMNFVNFIIPVFTQKINNYIEYYLQVSWSPLLLCLKIAPRRLRRYCSPMPKFDSEFLKTYEVQKFWKVPDPDIREVLRRAITEKVTSGLTQYLGDSDTVRITGSTFTLQELEEMLQELFEG